MMRQGVSGWRKLVAGGLLGISALMGAYAPKAQAADPIPQGQLSIPVAVHSPGANDSLWRTDLKLLYHADADPTNDATPPTVGVCLHTNEASECKYLTPKENEIVTLDNIVEKTFDKTSTTGTMTLWTNRDPNQLQAMAQTYTTTTAGGRLGVGLNAMPMSQLIQTGEEANVFGARDPENNRYNISLFSPNGDAKAVLTLTDNYNNVRATKEVSINRFAQFPLYDLFEQAPQIDDNVHVAVTQGALGVYVSEAHGTTARPGTNNPTVYMAQKPQDAITELLIPAVVSAPGARGDYTSVLRKSNPQDDMNQIVHTYYPRESTSTSLELFDNLANRETLTDENIVTRIRENNRITPTAASVGFLTLRSASGMGFNASSDVYNIIEHDDGTQEVYGSHVEGQTSADAARGKSGLENDTRAAQKTSSFVEQDPTQPEGQSVPNTRTNIVLVHAKPEIVSTGETATGNVVLYDASGVEVARKPYSLPPNTSTQFPLTEMYTGTISGRVDILADNNPQNSGYVYSINSLASVINKSGSAVTTKGHVTTIPNAVKKVTGEEYVNYWYPTGNATRYITNSSSNPEVKCFIQGGCGTRSYSLDLATILSRGQGVYSSPAVIDNALKNWVDDNLSNGQLHYGFDPMTMSMTKNIVSFNMAPTGQTLINTTLTRDDMLAVDQLLKNYLIERVDANNTIYGLDTAKKVTETKPATWNTQDLY